MPAGVVGHAVQVAALVVVEYCPAVQFVHTVSADTVHAVLLLLPAWHTVQALQTVALAADNVLPATHGEHTLSEFAEQADDR